MIPGLYNGRDKTFFMVAYEGVRGEAITSPIASVPTALMRQGNFSEITTPIRDPCHEAALPGQHHPAPRCSIPTSLELLQYYPAPTRAGTANNYQGPSERSDNVDQVLVRARPEPRQQGAAEPPLQLARQLQRPTRSTRCIPVAAVTQPRTNKNWLLGYTHTLSPNLLNDFRIGYHQRRASTP